MDLRFWTLKCIRRDGAFVRKKSASKTKTEEGFLRKGFAKNMSCKYF